MKNKKLFKRREFTKRIFGLSIVILLCITTSLIAQTNALKIIPNGNVGIGTDSPSEKLEVDGNIKSNGRLKDKTGIIMPIGTILPYGGTIDSIPAGWILCDGREVARIGQYSELFSVIGTSYGSGDNSTTFNIPAYSTSGKFETDWVLCNDW